MRAMHLKRIVDLGSVHNPLTLVDVPKPMPAAGEILVRITACAVCHTELDEIEGRTPPPRLPVIPGHQVVGRVSAVGEGSHRFSPGTRVGIGWIHHSDGSPRENVAPEFVATGRDVDGGYAEFMVVPENYAAPIPDEFDDTAAAPLLCAGAIGYRAFRMTELPSGAKLGFMGFGASAHLLLPLVKHLAAMRTYVFARQPKARNLAMALGADWAGVPGALPPVQLDAVIDTTPSWRAVLQALDTLRPGGRLVINAIRKEEADRDALNDLSYARHLWMEKQIVSVANITASDIAEYLPLAAAVPLRPTVTTWPLEQANEALLAIRSGRAVGAQVLLIATAS